MYPSKCPKCNKWMTFYMTYSPTGEPFPHFKCSCGYDTSNLYTYTSNRTTLNNIKLTTTSTDYKEGGIMTIGT